MRSLLTGTTLILATLLARPAWAEEPVPADEPPTDTAELLTLQQQLAAERRALDEQRQIFAAQERRLQALEDALLDKMRATGIGGAGLGGSVPGLPDFARLAPAQPSESVGVKPAQPRAVQEVAVLADRGSVLTKAGRLTIEPSIEYTRADRNRFVFRGIEVPQSVLVGVFDINESRQNILTAAASLRMGLSDRLEVGIKVPWVYRDDGFVLVPLVQNPPQSGAGTIDRSTRGNGLGDLEVTARYLLTSRAAHRS